MIYHSQSYNTDSEDAFFGKRSFKGRMIRTALRRRMVLRALAAKKKRAKRAKIRYIKKNSIQPIGKRKRSTRQAIKRTAKSRAIIKRVQTSQPLNNKPIMPRTKRPQASIKRVVKFQPFTAVTSEKQTDVTEVTDPKEEENNTNLYIGLTVAAIAVTGIVIYLKNKR